MADMMYCLVDGKGVVYTKDGADSYAEVAALHGLDESTCGRYRFDFVTRRLLEDQPSRGGDGTVNAFLFRQIGTPERFMRYAADGHVPRQSLINLLESDNRKKYAVTCAEIERSYTAACRANNDPCLESGCSMDQGSGDICLQPLLAAGDEYDKACVFEWAKLFSDPDKRIAAWRSR